MSGEDDQEQPATTGEPAGGESSVVVQDLTDEPPGAPLVQQNRGKTTLADRTRVGLAAALVGLVGSVVGFYFGSHAAGDASK